MRFFDLHCDTVTECYKQQKQLYENDLHLSVERGNALDAWGQVFAIWIPDTYRGQAAWEYFEENYAFFLHQTQANSISFCRSFAQTQDAMRQKKCAALLAVEGGAVLAGELENVQRLYDKGVRLLTLTWNAENELGYGCQSEGGTMKPFGIEVLHELEKYRMIADVSHLCKTGFYDVLEQSNGAVIASHSTSAEVLRSTRTDSLDKTFSIRRALEDDQVRALCAHGGLIGLNFCGSFLGDPGEDGMEAALRHIYRFLELGAENNLSIGSDFDGCTIHPELSGIEKMPSFYEYLRNNGFEKTLCDKIFFENALHFMKNVL